MNKLLISSALLLFLISCKKKDSNSTTTSFTPDCSGAAASYMVTVGPLITSNCATSGCHAAGNTNGPGALTTYAQVKSSSASIRSSVLNGTMPKNSTLTSAQKNNIICWIDAGAANN